MKKFLSIALVFAMLLSFAVFASAEGETCSITIENSASGYTYAAYQIFSGDLGQLDGKTVLSNINWGSGVSIPEENDFQTKILAALGDPVLGAAFSAEYVASKLTETNAKTFAKAIANYLSTTASTFTYDENNKNYKATVPAAGYYLIKNTEVPTGGAYTAYIMQVLGDVTATHKADVPTVVKKVEDTNDTTGYIKDNWQDSADHDIGDTIRYKVTATIPAGTLQNFDSYYLTFTDTLSKGLTYTGEETDVANENSYLTLRGYAEYDGELFLTSNNIQCKYFKQDKDDQDCTVLTVRTENIVNRINMYSRPMDITKEIEVSWTYTCQLNSDAVIGANGNPNDVYLTYSNNPNGEGEGTTPKDSAIVFTYQVQVDKVDQDKKPLTGAFFTLYKQVTDKEVTKKFHGAETGAAIKAELKDGLQPNVKADALNDDSFYVVCGILDNEGSTFRFKGLDDGTYVLVETTIPDGYNAWESKGFTVTASHPGTTLESLSGGELFTGKIDLTNGKLTTSIENKSGNTLPSTGGMGTTIFYIFGTILVLGAGILLIAKKRVAR